MQFTAPAGTAFAGYMRQSRASIVRKKVDSFLQRPPCCISVVKVVWLVGGGCSKLYAGSDLTSFADDSGSIICGVSPALDLLGWIAN